MNKVEATEWMKKEGLAENKFTAGHIWENLELFRLEENEQKYKVRLYRAWRKISNDRKLCFALANAMMDIPSMYGEKKEEKIQKIAKELGFYE